MAGNERLTEFEVLYELVDLGAADDASYSATHQKSFSNLPLLSTIVPFDDYITLEHNYSIMDGTMPEFPNTIPNIPYWSQYESDMEGTWTEDKTPTIDITFDDLHSSVALTLMVPNPDVVMAKITWYRYDVILAEGNYPINANGVCGEPVVDYNRIHIEFSLTVPDRYVKLFGIYYGVKLNWDETTVKTANMVKEIDIISTKLPVDTLSFELVDITFGDLNLGNPQGIHRFFQRNQPMYAYEWLNDTRMSIGKFFLKTYEHKDNVGKFSCVSYIDKMDDIAFNTGRLYDGILAGVLIKEVFDTVGITNYEIDNETYNQKLYGTLKPQSCRSALREILFACQSIADTSNPDKVYIRKISNTIASTVSRHIKFNTSVKQLEYVSGVHVEYPSFKKVNEEAPITEETLYEAGDHIVIFDGPYDTVNFSTLSGISNIQKSTYFVKFHAGRDVTLTLTGQGYIETANSVDRNKELEAGRFLNVKKFVSTLSNYQNAKRIADILLAYYSLDMEISIKALAMDTDMEHRYIVENDTPKYNDYIGAYSQRTFDLTGGFIHNSKLSMTFLTDANKSYFAREAGLEEIFLDQEETAII